MSPSKAGADKSALGSRGPNAAERAAGKRAEPADEADAQGRGQNKAENRGRGQREVKAPVRSGDDAENRARDRDETEYRVDLPEAGFEGPLDLLLHLIQEHELDILDIPMGFVTERFLAYLKLMDLLSIDIASEYLVMAATLTHIKSKMLLPVVPAGQEDDGLPGEEDDPRAELVMRLLEYQKYKAAAAELAERGTLGKDIFGRGTSEPVPEGPAPFAPATVFSLLDAFEKILKRTKVRLDHEVVFDRISITDRILELTERLEVRRRMQFEEMLQEPHGQAPTRFDVVITFLAVLEMARLRIVRVYQSDPLAPIHIELAADPSAPIDAEVPSEMRELHGEQEPQDVRSPDPARFPVVDDMNAEVFGEDVPESPVEVG